MFEQPLQQKEITNGERLILASRRHMTSKTVESCKNLARGTIAVSIKSGAERGRSPLGDRLRDPSRMLIGRHELWLGSIHRVASSNRATIAGICIPVLPKSAKPTAKSARDWRMLS